MVGVSPARQASTAQSLKSPLVRDVRLMHYSSERRPGHPSKGSPEETDQGEATTAATLCFPGIDFDLDWKV